MFGKSRITIASILALFVVLCAIAVIIGWVFDIRVLKSISPAWVTMKFDTAVAFLLSGVTLYFIPRAKEGEFDLAQVALSITCLILFMLIGMLFFSTIFGVHTGVENLFIEEAAGGVKTVTPGLPSIPTMINFILIALAGILTILNYRNQLLVLRIVGFIIGITGILALVGYGINIPLLYYYINGINSAMALHTAVLFILLGLGFVCL